MKGVDAYGKRGMALLSLWELKELLAGGISGPPPKDSLQSQIWYMTQGKRDLLICLM